MQLNAYPHDLDPYASSGTVTAPNGGVVTINVVSDNSDNVNTGEQDPNSWAVSYTGSGRLASALSFNPQATGARRAATRREATSKDSPRRIFWTRRCTISRRGWCSTPMRASSSPVRPRGRPPRSDLHQRRDYLSQPCGCSLDGHLRLDAQPRVLQRIHRRQHLPFQRRSFPATGRERPAGLHHSQLAVRPDSDVLRR